jgi:hypothetical protein
MVSVRPSARLTADETGELDLARAHLHALVSAAQRLVTLANHDPDVADCADAGCRLAAGEHGPALCPLAHRLALLGAAHPDDIAPDDAAPDDDPDRALADFRAALVESLDAVRTCRSVGHAEGHCWFSSSTDVDGCGEVLRAAHLAG